MATCPTSPKPNYTTFVNNYLSYAQTASRSLQLPVAAILAHWYQEWGMPIKNPTFQTWAPSGICVSGYCGGSTGNAFPIFCTLNDGVQAYIKQMNYYNDGSHIDIFGFPTKLSTFFNIGYKAGGKTATVKNDNGNTVIAQGVTHYGLNDIPEFPTPQQLTYYEHQALYSVLEALGASEWDAGYYFSGTDIQPGQSLINIVINSGWQDLYNYIY
ncbi:MAG: hypothetical protein ACPL3A_11010 [Thermoanaerobacteraceae bacterium]